MQDSNWQRQESNKPLFPDLLWSRPENKARAGKLLIIGGNSHGMQAPAQAYECAVSAGIGVAKVLLPEALHKLIGRSLEHVEFAASNKSGGFSKKALIEWVEYANWADAVMLAGDTARNSETAMVMEEFTKKYKGKIAVTQDCLDQFITSPKVLFNRPNTLIVASFGQLQKVWPKVMTGKGSLRFDMSLPAIVEALHEYSETLPTNLIVKHLDQIIVAADGYVSTTKNEEDIWRVKTCARASVWWLQNPENTYQAITMSIL